MSKYKELFSEDWYNKLSTYINSELPAIIQRINTDRLTHRVIPDKGSTTWFRAFRETPYNKVKIVILGQDPYPTIENNGVPTFDGLAFSNANSISPSPSLRNILKEIERTYGISGDVDLLDLTRWSKQGVLLINTAHSVIEKKPNSHKLLWNNFTTEVLKVLNDKNDIVWLLWGKEAQSYKQYITNTSHAIIETGHPSPLNRNNAFVGSNCFVKANEELSARNIKEIVW